MYITTIEANKKTYKLQFESGKAFFNKLFFRIKRFLIAINLFKNDKLPKMPYTETIFNVYSNSLRIIVLRDIVLIAGELVWCIDD